MEGPVFFDEVAFAGEMKEIIQKEGVRPQKENRGARKPSTKCYNRLGVSKNEGAEKEENKSRYEKPRFCHRRSLIQLNANPPALF